MVAALNLLASFSLAVPIGECSSASSIILCKKLIYSEVVGESIALFARQLDPGFTPNDIPESCVANLPDILADSDQRCAYIIFLLPQAIFNGLYPVMHHAQLPVHGRNRVGHRCMSLVCGGRKHSGF